MDPMIAEDALSRRSLLADGEELYTKETYQMRSADSKEAIYPK